jgi:hypothetical protein
MTFLRRARKGKRQKFEIEFENGKKMFLLFFGKKNKTNSVFRNKVNENQDQQCVSKQGK